MKKLFPYLKPYILLILLLIGLVVIQVMTDLALPDYLSDIINKGIILQNNDIIIEIGKEMVGVAMIGAIATIAVGYLASRVSTGISRDLREGIYSKVLSFSATDFEKFSTSSILTRSTNDVQQVQMVIFMFLRMVISAPILGVGAVIKAFQKAPDMTWIIALAVITVLTVMIVVFVLAVPKFKLLQKLVDKLNQVSRENLTGLRVIRAFNTQKYEQEKFDVVNKDLTKVSLFVNKLMIFMQPLMFMILNLTSVAIVWFGAHLLDEGKLEIGDMLAFMQYSLQVIMSFLMLTMIIIFITRASVSIQRIAEILKSSSSIKDPKKPKSFSKDVKGIVEYKKVSFAYSDSEEAVIKDVSFVAKPGETTAFVGSTGSGKSTVINLLPRFHDVTEGQILVDGIDIRDVKQKDLRERIGYVPQKGYLFSGSIGSNLKYGKSNASEKELISSSKIAQAYEFISKYKKGFDKKVSQAGSNLSGGQKQRISIARALVKNPDIYIFDDSFSALDLKTERALREQLSKKIKSATVLIVAQRISTIMNAENIIVLEAGKIVGQGTHDQLLKKNKVYREIALSQLSEEELNISKRNF